MIKRLRIARQEGERRDDPADVAESYLPRRADGTAVVPTQVHGEPANDDGHCGVDAGGDEEESAVLEMVVVVCCDENGETGNCDSDGDEGEEETVMEEVRKGGHEYAEAECGSLERR